MRDTLEVPGVDGKDVEEALLGKAGQRIQIYKLDGSLQCDMGHPLSLPEMAQQLEGIEILSQQKKRDGQMRIQVCGHPTGMANVYEIAAKDWPEAEKRGFKIWEFD